ncbi:c-type cytochrome [Pandoraea cepalis]|uniref:c-type cytochrome n=1 Tax=Pandoraea cepalis TaxID=2508294 RepID=UPI001241C968|nr:hypothetical protein [Pandoraea cepalis]
MRTRAVTGSAADCRDRLPRPSARWVTPTIAAALVLTIGTGVVATATAWAAPVSGVRAASPVYVEPAAPQAPQPDWQARDWAMACMTCHNASAPVSTGKATLPALDGRPATELMSTLQAMRDGQRTATLMPQLLKGYRDDELRRIAAYFASQPAGKGASASPRTPQTSQTPR